MNQAKVEFGKQSYRRVTALADQKGQSLMVLAKGAGLGQNVIYYWQFGQMPQLKSIIRLALKTHVTCDYLLMMTTEVKEKYVAKEHFSFEEILWSFQCRIEDIKDETGWNYATIEKETGMNSHTASRWINGKSFISAWNLIKLCRYFGISADYMLGLTEEKNLPSLYT